MTAQQEVAEPIEVPRKSDDELRKFIDDYISGRIFTSAQVRRPDDLRLVFLPIGFGAFSDSKDQYVQSIGALYEYYSEAGPRSMNGMPMFTSVRVIHKDDWAIVMKNVQIELERREKMPLVK